MPKNLKGEFFNIHSVAKYLKIWRGPLETLKNFQKKVTKPKNGSGESLIVPKKLEMVILLRCNGFVFNVRGFGCAQSQVLSTYGKSAQFTKSGTYSVSSVV